jgi:hypothetical protein
VELELNILDTLLLILLLVNSRILFTKLFRPYKEKNGLYGFTHKTGLEIMAVKGHLTKEGVEQIRALRLKSGMNTGRDYNQY